MRYLVRCPKCERSFSLFRLLFLTSIPVLRGFNDRVPCPAGCRQSVRYDLSHRLVSFVINAFLMTVVFALLLFSAWPLDFSERSLLLVFTFMVVAIVSGFLPAYLYFVNNVRFESEP